VNSELSAERRHCYRAEITLNILGVSFDYHDSAAALLVDGRVIAAAQEERFSRCKHDAKLPENAIAFCLHQAGLSAADLDAVVFHESTSIKLDRIVTAYLHRFQESPTYLQFVEDLWAHEGKFYPLRRLSAHLDMPDDKLFRVGHHEAHAASAFYCSPFDEAVIVTMDGVGEYDTTTVALGRNNRIEELYAGRLPHSLGLLYSAFTAFLGFEVNEGEYKVMGMAAFGRPRFADQVRKLVELTDDGLFKIDQSCFEFYCPQGYPYNERMKELFGAPRPPSQPFRIHRRHVGGAPDDVEKVSQHYADLAASLQIVTEEVILHLVRSAMRRTGMKNVCLAGGVALNSVANARLQREIGCSLYVQPSAGDSGAALGAALAWHHSQGGLRTSPMTNPFLGKEYDANDIMQELNRHNLPLRRLEEDELCDVVTDLIAKGCVVGWMQGRFEWGPRALGNRSILADPRRADMKDIVNVKIKFREPFRPFAPSVLAHRAHDYFDFPAGLSQTAPENFMLAIALVKQGMEKVIPAVTHADGTARLQLVLAETNPLYFKLISVFERKTGVPLVLNTSFNLKGEAMVDKPYDALQTFAWSGMDAVVMGNYLVLKDDLPCA
jgi:carbamoyltransferase